MNPGMCIDKCGECGRSIFQGHDRKCRTGKINGIIHTSVEYAKHFIASCDDASLLNEALIIERDRENRVTLIRMLERRIRRLRNDRMKVA